MQEVLQLWLINAYFCWSNFHLLLYLLLWIFEYKYETENIHCYFDNMLASPFKLSLYTGHYFSKQVSDLQGWELEVVLLQDEQKIEKESSQAIPKSIKPCRVRCLTNNIGFHWAWVWFSNFSPWLNPHPKIHSAMPVKSVVYFHARFN